MAERHRGLARTLRVGDVADHFDVDTKRVYGWIEDGTLTALRLPGRNGHVTIRIRREDLDDFERRWLGQNSEGPSTDSAGEPTESSPSAGPIPAPAKRSPFQRGKVINLRPKSGATSS